MSASLRRIVVDDTDPAISYGPGWSIADPNKLNALGNYGPIYNGTSHSTIVGTTATLSFPFNGTSVTVLGTLAITTANNVTDPTWDCFVDEIKITNPNPTFQFAENNWDLCDQSQIASGSHTLTLQVQSKGSPFYLDKIIYTPLPTANEEVAVLEYSNVDPAVSFGSGWRIWGAQNVTQTTGAQVALNFHGTSVSLFGYIPTELPHNATTASYTIDGGNPTTFTLQGLAASAQSATLYNALIFSIGTLTPTTHNLVVTYGGDSAHTPLVVGSFYVTNTSTPSTTSSAPGSTSSNDASTVPVVAKTTRHSSTGAIVGGILGCLAVLAFIVGVAFWCRRRRRREMTNLQGAAAQPYAMSMADTAPASAAGGAPYSYAAVPANYGHSQPGSPDPASARRLPAGSGFAYPYGASSPSVAASSSVGISHVHSASASSGGLVRDLATHVNDILMTGATAYPTPVPSDASSAGPTRKYEREAMASATMAAPAITADSVLRPQRAGQLQQRPVVLQRHQDSGVRLDPAALTEEPEIIELPPDYSRH
ncbi:hypothetical protein C8R46DRAFT_304476 [Mycena filopes]|nr:hypothetical protein C8R46DRAFT_304476 [Mycena filopes]